MRYEDVGSIAGCVQDVCEDACLTQAAVKLWPAGMCAPPASVPVGTEGAQEGPAEAPPDGAVANDASPVAPMNVRPQAAGCACSASATGPGPWWALAVLVAGFRWRRPRRR